MTELELYKFIEESGSETYIYDGDKAIIWVAHCWVTEFADMIGYGMLDMGGIEVRLQESVIAVEMNDICEYHDIEVEKVFERTND